MANENEGKKDRLGWFLIGASVILVLAVLVRGRHSAPVGTDSSSSDQPVVGKMAPDIALEFPPGNRTSLHQNLGKAILVNFWASWCEPCMEEMPSLVALEKQMADKPFLLLALDVDDDPDAARADIAGRQMPKNLVFEFARSSLGTYSVSSIPLSVLIDRRGIIKDVIVGPRDWTDPESVQEVMQALN